MQKLLFVFYFFLGSVVFGQSLLDKKISVHFKKTNLIKCLIQIEDVSGISFSYNSKQIQHIDKKFNRSFENQPIRNILDYLIIDTKLKYKEIGEQVTIYELNNSTESVVISGYILEKESDEALIGAKIIFPELGIGCFSNSYGYYALEIPKGINKFKVISIGMLPITDQVYIEEEMVLNIELETDTVVLNIIEVRSDSLKTPEEIVDISRLDKTTITPIAISRVPAATGERDLMRHLQQLPGVQPANSGGANFIVRGSGTGNNLILIDEIPIYHPTHLLGIYSIVNTDAIKSATFYKDYIPLKFGTRSSAVLQVHTKEGNLKKYHISGGLSGFMARLNIEGPIIKRRASFYIGGRISTFPGPLLNVLGDRNLGNPFFNDLNVKVNFKLNSNNRIYFTGYIGQDILDDSTSLYQWGNTAGSFRWNHIINSKTFSNLSITHSSFAYGFTLFNDLDNNFFEQRVITNKLNYDFTYFHNNTTLINYGFSTAYLRTGKGKLGFKDADFFLKRQSLENGFYASVEKKISRKLSIKGGIRLPFSFHIGTGATTSYLNPDLSLTTKIYEKNKLYDPTLFIDPRVVGTYRLTEADEFQFAAMITSQNTHIVNYINYFLPIEIWTPSTTNLRPERNYQVSVGWTHHLKNLKTSVIAYKKHVTNVLDYASPVFTSSKDIESNLLAGTLRVMGLELMVNYAFTTWYSASASYSYTKTRQHIIGINNDLPYVAPNDRPHYFSFSQYFNLTKKWQITTNITVHSGTAITLPNAQIILENTAIPIYSSKRNATRLPQYRRLDLSFRRQLGVKKKKNHWDMTFTITNFFNRHNPSVAYFSPEVINPSVLNIKTLDYAPLMLSLNVNFKY